MSTNLQHFPTISLIIPVYNGGEDFTKCLASIPIEDFALKEVIIVSDNDSDGSWLVAKNYGFKVLKLTENKGPATARNYGVAQAIGDIVLFIDADVLINVNTISTVADVFRKEPSLAALIGSYDDTPYRNDFLSQYKNLFHHYTHQNGREDASTFWTGCGAIRRDIFLQIGGFNEAYRYPCIEDIELGYRLKAEGYNIKLCKEIQVKHLKRWGIISLIKADFFWRAIPWTQLIVSRNQPVNDLNLNWTNRLSVVCVYLLVLGLTISVLYKIWIYISILLVLTLLFLNFSLYRFFYSKRGVIFAFMTIPWHWFYYFYGGLAFVIGIISQSRTNNKV